MDSDGQLGLDEMGRCYLENKIVESHGVVHVVYSMMRHMSLTVRACYNHPPPRLYLPARTGRCQCAKVAEVIGGDVDCYVLI